MISLKSLYRSSQLLRSSTQKSNMLSALLSKQNPVAFNSRSFSAFVNHRNTEDNLDETPFEFTKENYETIN